MAIIVMGKLLFLRTPRTASTATAQLLIQKYGGKRWGPGQHQYYPPPNGEPCACTVRNPLDILASWFLNQEQYSEMEPFLNQYNNDDFHPDGELFYLVPRCRWVMCYDRLQSDFDALMQAVGLPARVLPKANLTAEKQPYRTYWKPETRALAQTLFRKDFETYARIANHSGLYERES